jgi:hypothetical protein
MYNVLLWNFANKEVPVEVAFDGLPRAMRSRHIRLDAVTTSSDENARLRPDPFKQMKPGERVSLVLEPYAVHYWSIE